MERFGRFWRDESAALAIEYSLILAFVAMAVVGGFSLFGRVLREMMTAAGTKFPKGG
jgi:Flp pilus assembly pilin Flp